MISLASHVSLLWVVVASIWGASQEGVAAGPPLPDLEGAWADTTCSVDIGDSESLLDRACLRWRAQQTTAVVDSLYRHVLFTLEQSKQGAVADADSSTADMFDHVEYFARQIRLLEESQEVWIRYRDAACAAAGAKYWGGSMSSLTVVNCRTEHNLARIKELKWMVE